MNTITRQYIIDIADEKNLYDKSLWDKYLSVKENLKKYDFISFFNFPSHYVNAERKKEYLSLVNQILLFRKKYYDDLPTGARIIFDQSENKTQKNELV